MVRTSIYSNASCVLLVCVPHCAIIILQNEPGSEEMGIVGPPVSCRPGEHYTEFCPHWSAVVGSNYHSAFLTTTQLMLNSIHSILENPFS